MTQATDSEIREIRDLILGMDKKIDGLDKRLEVFQARTDEQFKSIDQRLSTLENRVAAQDSRLWTFVSALVLALIGLLAKLAFFPKL
ncbi:hypothetical protein GS597_01255 [Synechococcales cyanobacterium C]|uniref:Uncharacterized protein n=1 Tax=Petrachloros mirabilis ULC683 TaxID=2781853 RepID=A0A8K2ANA5_9CYAN|nr:hypothetical protein [Petrachloros mirabilis]NCJ05166.1 hypothetical protein [Petrachloros mirabilis ULC683]